MPAVDWLAIGSGSGAIEVNGTAPSPTHVMHITGGLAFQNAVGTYTDARISASFLLGTPRLFLRSQNNLDIGAGAQCYMVQIGISSPNFINVDLYKDSGGLVLLASRAAYPITNSAIWNRFRFSAAADTGSITQLRVEWYNGATYEVMLDGIDGTPGLYGAGKTRFGSPSETYVDDVLIETLA